MFNYINDLEVEEDFSGAEFRWMNLSNTGFQRVNSAGAIYKDQHFAIFILKKQMVDLDEDGMFKMRYEVRTPS